MGTPIRVLIIGDSEKDSRLYLQCVKNAGFKPRLSRIGSAGELKKALKQPWDLIIFAERRRRFAVDRALKIINQKGLDVPFIVVAETLSEESFSACLKSGRTIAWAKTTWPVWRRSFSGKCARLVNVANASGRMRHCMKAKRNIGLFSNPPMTRFACWKASDSASAIPWPFPCSAAGKKAICSVVHRSIFLPTNSRMEKNQGDGPGPYRCRAERKAAEIRLATPAPGRYPFCCRGIVEQTDVG